jgi:cystathionine beta-lyase
MVMRTETLLIHGGIDGDPNTGAVNVPIHQTSTFRQSGFGQTPTWEYSRSANPTRTALEALIRDLEHGQRGFAFASGLSALATVFALFNSGDRVVIAGDVYGGSHRLLTQVWRRFGIEATLAAADDIPALETELSAPEVKAVLVESPSNPLGVVADLAAVAAAAHRHGALAIVDNTLLTPYLQNPLTLGADVVVHSASKYLGGHCDLIAGLAVVKDPELGERLGFLQNAIGAVLAPQDSFLLIRGIKTLAVRMDRHLANTQAVAQFLATHPTLTGVNYAGLESHPGHAVHRAQARGAGGVVSFELAPEANIANFFNALRVFTFAESLGGVESLASHPASMTHASIPAAVRETMGISDRLVRLSVGLEHQDDLIGDLKQALQQAQPSAAASDHSRSPNLPPPTASSPQTPGAVPSNAGTVL